MEKFEEFEAFFKNPNEGEVPGYSIDDGFHLWTYKDEFVNPWRDGLCDHLITGHLELLIEEDKAMFFLELNKTVEDAFIHWTSQDATGILYKNSEESLGCSVLVESWRSENYKKSFQAEVLYFEFPGEFDYERLELSLIHI